MIEVGFYQLALRPVEAVVPPLVVKARGAGYRLLLRSDDPTVLAMIDDALWRFSAASFLPHGRAEAIEPERVTSQPVLLDTAFPPANGADCLMQLGGDLPDDVSGLRRVLFLFGEAELETARARWRRLKADASVAPVYWREGEGGRFEKAA